MASEPERIAVSKILERCDNPCIVDLGAYHGEDTDWMVRACRRPYKAIMVEADPQNFKEHVIEISLRNACIAVFGAVSDYTGECDFWACYTPDGRGSGSIRKPTGHLVEKPWYDFQTLPGKIPCFTLDDLCAKHGVEHIDVLWVDIQGAENSMIAGGKETLKRTRYLFMEAEKRILYDGQIIREDLLAMLPGWTVIGDFDFNLLLRNDN
jgi:FkbM family methyltransferase